MEGQDNGAGVHGDPVGSWRVAEQFVDHRGDLQSLDAFYRHFPIAGIPPRRMLCGQASETAKQVRSPKQRFALTEIWAFEAIQLCCSRGSRQEPHQRIPIFSEPALEAPTSKAVPSCRIASPSHGLSTRNESVCSQEKVSRIVKCACTVECRQYCAFLPGNERRFEPAA